LTRLIIIVVVSLIVAVADFAGWFVVAFGAGVLAGAGFFLVGTAQGGMRPVGLAAPHLMPANLPKQASSPNAGIGCGLAASGIASSVVSKVHYPYAFRIFYGICICAGLVIALVLAWRARNGPTVPSAELPPGG
jgi:hypothetical protein